MPARFPIHCALALATLGAAAAPAAHAAWTPPRTLVSDASAENVDAAGDARGSEVFVWKVTSSRPVRTRTQTGPASYVRARIRRPDGGFGRVETISATEAIVASPRIGVDERGNATAVWTQAGRHLTIMAAVRRRGGRFGPPFALGRSGHFIDARPVVAVGRSGDAVVAWNAGRSVRVVRRGPSACGRGCFGAPLRLRAGSDQAVAVGPRGRAYVVWAAQRITAGDFHTSLRIVVIGRDGRPLGRERAVSHAADGDASQPALAVRRDGTAVVAWRASLPAGGEQDGPAPIMAATIGAGGIVAQPQTVSLQPSEQPQVRLGADGEAILAWNQWQPTAANPDGPEIAVAAQPAQAPAFGAPTAMTPANVVGGSVSLAVDATGAAHLVYSASAATGSAPGDTVGISHVRPPGGDFGPPLALPAGFTRAFVFSAGARVTAVGGGNGGRVLLSDWTG